MADAKAQWTAGSHVIARLGFYLQTMGLTTCRQDTRLSNAAGRITSLWPVCMGWRSNL
jgi:hypothetical protein